jgi:hypothetical protein
MIKTILVRLDGTAGDEFRMAATESLCRLFDAHVIGLFFNVLPDQGYAVEPTSPEIWASLNERVRQNGDEMAARLGKRLDGLGRSAELRSVRRICHRAAGYHRSRVPDCRRLRRPAPQRCRSRDRAARSGRAGTLRIGPTPLPCRRPEDLRWRLRSCPDRMEPQPRSRARGRRGPSLPREGPPRHGCHDRA